MDSNPICQPSPTNKMKCSFLEYVQLLMISLAGQWTRTPSASPLQPKKWNATFWITFNFWWLAGLVNGLKPNPPPLSSQRNEMLIFLLCSTSNDQPGLSMDLNPIHHLSPAKKWNAHILIMFNFWWLAGLVDGLEPHPPPLSTQKNEMLIFGLCSTSDDWLSCSIDLNPIHHPSPPKNMKSSFLDYVQLLMISQAGQWTWTPSATPLHPKKWNDHFWITFNFWWLAGLVDGLKPHPPQLFSQKMKSSFLDYVQLLMISQAGQWTRTPSATPLQPKKWNAHFWIMFNFRLLAWQVDGLKPHLPALSNFWWLARLVNGLEPHLPPLSSQKNEMLIFGLHSLWMIGQAGQWTQTPSTTPLQPIKWNASFWIMFTTDDQPGWSMDSKPHLPPLSIQKNEMLIFGLCSTSDDWPGWLMDSNPIHHPSPPRKMKCSFLDYVQLLMIGWAAWLTWTPSTTPLHPKRWNACLCITFNIWCWPDWSMDSNPICHPL